MGIRMKTTIELPDDVLLAAKRRALESRSSLRELVTRGLRAELARARRPRRGRRPLRLVTVAGALAPGLDLASREAMHDFLRRPT
jgi:hypothetical protein